MLEEKKHTTVCVCPGVDMCGRTVVVLVGRNIPVTIIDIEKVTECGFQYKSIWAHVQINLRCVWYVCVCACVCVCVCAGAAVLHPRHGPHRREGVRDGLLPHADWRAQPPGRRLPEEPPRHR